MNYKSFVSVFIQKLLVATLLRPQLTTECEKLIIAYVLAKV